jgi:serine/threonine-protein kinase
MDDDAINPGDVFLGRYRIRAILGRSRGLLVEAEHTEIEQRVVLRILPASKLDAVKLARFRRETRTLAKLESEHVARILDVGKMPDGGVYFARQFLEGMDLAAYVKAHNPLPLAEAVQLVLQAAEAVSEAHARRVIVRNLDPSHLFVAERVGRSPAIKVIDFGTAKWLRDGEGSGSDATPTTPVAVSPFAAPEVVARSNVVDERVDVYSLGAVLFFVLTGRPPFVGDLPHLLAAIARDPVVPVTQLRRDLPRALDPIVDWALAKTASGRFITVAAFAETIGRFAGIEGQALVQRIVTLTAARAAAKKAASAGIELSPEDLVTDETGLAQGDVQPDDCDSEENEPTRAAPLPARNVAEAPLTLTVGLTPAFVPAPATYRGAWERWTAPAANASTDVAASGAESVPALGTRPPSRPMYAGAAADIDAFPSQELRETVLAASPSKPQAPHAAEVATVGGPAPATPAVDAPPWQEKRTDKPQRIALAVVLGLVALLAVVAVGLVVLRPAAPTTDSMPDGAPRDTAAAGSTTPRPTSIPPRASIALASPADEGGTLVAVAVGGSCAFAVDGQPRGEASTLRLSVPPGTHQVTCAAGNGKPRSTRVSVAAGTTAVATFRLTP